MTDVTYNYPIHEIGSSNLFLKMIGMNTIIDMGQWGRFSDEPNGNAKYLVIIFPVIGRQARPTT